MDVPSNTAVAAAAEATATAGPQPSGARESGAGHSQAHSFLALTALGVVFGDIGTSPLYTFSVALAAAGRAPGSVEVLGIVSLTFWALMALISVKYVTFVLRADNDGEGGILALLSLVEHHHATSERVKLSIVVLLGVIGAALLYGDGVITPAISVLSAIEGLKFSPNAANFVVPVTLVILVGLFALQYRGTGSVGRLFGPVMVVWFVVIGVLGLVNIWATPAILEAFNPLEAVRFAIASPITLFIVLGGVFLALTGGEALYADMGHVGRPAIRQAWFGLVLPALVLCYFGQGARVLADPKAIENPFYSLAPAWALIPLVVLAALATIIASQALISGVFSMTRQAIQMGLCPRSKIVPTSSDEAGQVYLPTANWLLMAGTLLVVVMFKTSDALASAYGIAVSGTMLVTTMLLYRVAVAPLELAADCRRRWSSHCSAPSRRFSWCPIRSRSLQGGWFPASRRRRDRDRDAVLAQGLIGGAAAPLRHVDTAARSLPDLCRRSGHWPRAGSRRLADQGRARRLADADPPPPAQSRFSRTGGAVGLRARSPAARSVRRTPHGREHRPRLLPRAGAARLHADAGYPADFAEYSIARIRRRSRTQALLPGA